MGTKSAIILKTQIAQNQHLFSCKDLFYALYYLDLLTSQYIPLSELLKHVDVNLKPWLIKSGYYIVPSPSTALTILLFWLKGPKMEQLPYLVHMNISTQLHMYNVIVIMEFHPIMPSRKTLQLLQIFETYNSFLNWQLNSIIFGYSCQLHFKSNICIESIINYL